MTNGITIKKIRAANTEDLTGIGRHTENSRHNKPAIWGVYQYGQIVARIFKSSNVWTVGDSKTFKPLTKRSYDTRREAIEAAKIHFTLRKFGL